MHINTQISSLLSAANIPVEPRSGYFHVKTTDSELVVRTLKNYCTLFSENRGSASLNFTVVPLSIPRSFIKNENPFPHGEEVPSNNISDLHQFADKIVRKYTEGLDAKKAAAVLFQFLDNKEQYLTRYGSNIYYFYPMLGECCCSDKAPFFNRFVSNRREKIENEMVAYVTNNFMKTEPLKYLSVGTGLGLQDFINIGILLRLGYKEISVTRVETDPMTNSLLMPFTLLDEIAKELNLKLTIVNERSIKAVQGSFDIIQAVDFDDFESEFRKVFALRNNLKEKGMFSIACFNYDLVFGRGNCLRSEYVPIPKIKNDLEKLPALLNSLPSPLPATMRIAFLDSTRLLFGWTQLLPEICKNKAIKCIELMQVYPRHYNPDNVAETSDQYDSATVKEFLSHFTNGIRVEVTFIKKFDGKNTDFDFVFSGIG